MNCGNDPNARWTDGDAAMVRWYGEYLKWIKTKDRDRGPVPPAPEGADTTGLIGYQRPWTPDEKTETGIRISVKVSCGICGLLLGDVLPEEMQAIVDFGIAPDVTSECPNCRDEVRTEAGR